MLNGSLATNHELLRQAGYAFLMTSDQQRDANRSLHLRAWPFASPFSIFRDAVLNGSSCACNVEATVRTTHYEWRISGKGGDSVVVCGISAETGCAILGVSDESV